MIVYNEDEREVMGPDESTEELDAAIEELHNKLMVLKGKHYKYLDDLLVEMSKMDGIDFDIDVDDLQKYREATPENECFCFVGKDSVYYRYEVEEGVADGCVDGLDVYVHFKAKKGDVTVTDIVIEEVAIYEIGDDEDEFEDEDDADCDGFDDEDEDE